MALTTSKSKITAGLLTEEWRTQYGPSDKVPASGIYYCTNCKREVTCNKGDPFPTQNHAQHPSGEIRWQLSVMTDTSAGG